MTDTPVRFALLGAGGIAQAHALALDASPHCELVAVVDTDPHAAQTLADRCGAAAYTDHHRMLAGTGCDAAIVCTPPASHPALCLDLFAAGRHVLCEKPLAIDSASARAMLQAAEAAGVVFTMASKFRYVDDLQRARELARRGLVGELLLFENHFTHPIDMRGRWHADPAVSGGGVLIDNGTHSVDIVHYFLGPLTELQVVENRRFQDLPVEDTVTLLVRNATDVVGRIDLSWSLSLERRGFVNVIGSEGVIVVGWQSSAWYRHRDGQWTRFGDGYDKHRAFLAQLENFVAAIRGEEALRITPDDALASVEVIERAYRALRHRRWEPVRYQRYRRPRPAAAGQPQVA